MSQFFVYKLKPKASFHLGVAGVGIESTESIIHSDTLFAAIVSAWRYLGEVDANGNIPLLEPFIQPDGDMPFYLSSAFPYVGDTILLPRPRIKLGEDKATKDIEFLSMEALREIIQGKLNEKETIQRGKIMLTDAERKELDINFVWRSGKETREARPPRVTIDRITSQTAIYFCGRVSFEGNCGLYFWVDVRDDEYKAHLDRAIDFLSEEGLGGERSIGHGQFTFRCDKAELPTFSNPNPSQIRYLTFALYHPTEDEVCRDGVLDGATYKLIERGGWIYSPDGKSQRRRRIKMLKEGALFNKPVAGDIVSVEPSNFPHPVYRYGLAFPKGGLKMHRA
ncbi:MAG: type III-A CRISPR-associated RAMP protein Csm4 [Candidatus Poribacteria bacterium]